MIPPVAGLSLGILAGNGLYPELLVKALKRNGAKVVVAGIKGEARPEISCVADCFAPFPLGAIGTTARYFLQHGVREIFFSGGVVRHLSLLRARPDAAALRLALKSVFSGDDHLLRNTAAHFERLGLTVADPTPFLGALFAAPGHLAGPEPTEELLASLTTAWQAATALGIADRGQAALAIGTAVLAVEDRRGTDALISKARRPGAVLVKVVKPGQDRRFDMPAIGEATVTGANAFGLAAIGIEARGVLLLDKERICDTCDRLGICLISISGPMIESAPRNDKERPQLSWAEIPQTATN